MHRALSNRLIRCRPWESHALRCCVGAETPLQPSAQQQYAQRGRRWTSSEASQQQRAEQAEEQEGDGQQRRQQQPERRQQGPNGSGAVKVNGDVSSKQRLQHQQRDRPQWQGLNGEGQQHKLNGSHGKLNGSHQHPQQVNGSGGQQRRQPQHLNGSSRPQRTQQQRHSPNHVNASPGLNGSARSRGSAMLPKDLLMREKLEATRAALQSPIEAPPKQSFMGFGNLLPAAMQPAPAPAQDPAAAAAALATAEAFQKIDRAAERAVERLRREAIDKLTTPKEGGFLQNLGRQQLEQQRAQQQQRQQRVQRAQAQRAQRGRSRGRGGRRERTLAARKPAAPLCVEIPPDGMTVAELAHACGRKSDAIAAQLEKLGLESALGAVLDADSAELACLELGVAAQRLARKEWDLVRTSTAALGEEEAAKLPLRAPVVAVLGHVDHGKTTLLDALRKTNVAASEAAGITQRLGAFRVELPGAAAPITVFDTPGHAAFSAMRASAGRLTDVAVLVVAADDGLRAQTVEVLEMLQKVPHVQTVVAMTKCDKDDVDRKEAAKRIANQLLEHGIEVEEYGGSIPIVPVSGKTGEGLGDLVEAVLLQAEVMELRADNQAPGEGVVIDAGTDRGLGAYADIMVSWGALRAGDHCVVGAQAGRIKRVLAGRIKRVLVSESLASCATVAAGMLLSAVYTSAYADVMVSWGALRAGDHCVVGAQAGRIKRALGVDNKPVTVAGPSEAVRITGLKTPPVSGDELVVVASEARATQVASLRQRAYSLREMQRHELQLDEQRQIEAALAKERAKLAKDENAPVEPAAAPTGPISVPAVFKASGHGALAAMISAVEALPGKDEVLLKVAHSGVGPVTNSDVERAAAAGCAPLFAYGVGAVGNDVAAAARALGVAITRHDVIYRFQEDVAALLEERLPPRVAAVALGRADVLKAFVGVAGVALGRADVLKATTDEFNLPQISGSTADKFNMIRSSDPRGCRAPSAFGPNQKRGANRARLCDAVVECRRPRCLQSRSLYARAHAFALLGLFTVDARNKGGDVAVAGCRVTEGSLRAVHAYRVLRDGAVIHSAPRVGALQHLKDRVAEVRKGQECGVSLDGFSDFREGDVIETYESANLASRSRRLRRHTPQSHSYPLRTHTPPDSSSSMFRMAKLVPTVHAAAAAPTDAAHDRTAEAERKASKFAVWANENPMLAMGWALAPTAGWAGYAAVKHPGMRFSERFARTGMIGNAALLSSAVGMVSVFWVWELLKETDHLKHPESKERQR
ncbi:hypothetical protein JKP88DRAFT_261371 [Tribonema minus]|uniref:Tr-type G domain-containing protein n=1 Tax=Tribonema minus TaxID=303371 RepID=A0A836CAJ2_9STRA|nr:hypothetical protein JKP88DRAFT_261371 [Tribonema minus]